MAEPQVKEAKLQVSLKDIKFNEENKLKAILACIPIVGLVFLLVEKEDNFVRFYGAQYTVIGAIQLAVSVLAVIPILGWCLIGLVSIASIIAIIMGMLKASKGEVFELPMVTEWAVKLMNAI